MYGNIVSSNGKIEMGTLTEKEIIFEKPIYYLSIHIGSYCMIYVNDDPDGIYLPTAYTQPFILKDLPIFKIKVCRHEFSMFPNNDGELPPFYFSYYGFY